MPLKPADMTSCTKKAKCLAGPNAGIAYTPGDECTNPNETFDFVNCDCIPPVVECNNIAGVPDTDCSMWRIHGVKAASGNDYYDIRSFGSPRVLCSSGWPTHNNETCYGELTVFIQKYTLQNDVPVLVGLEEGIRICLSGSQTPVVQHIRDVLLSDPDYWMCF